jgi:phage-related minor tail protein
MSQGDVEARVVADTSGLQAGMTQAAVVTEAMMKRIAQYVKAANDETAKLGKTSKKAADDAGSAYKTIADGAEKVRSGHAGVNRELLVLAHELSQGNVKNFGGSLLVLAERVNFLEFALSGAGIAATLLGGAVLGSVGLIALGAIESDKFSKSLQLTGNYAAVTEQQIRDLAAAQAKLTGQTIGASRESLQTIAGTGLFGPTELAAAARAMGDYQRLTHKTAEEAVKDFSSIQNGVAKWAEEQNKSVHFLTAAEYEHIKSLEDTGQKQQAVIETLQLYAQTIESRAGPQTNALAAGLHAAGESASFLSEALKNIGRGTTSNDYIAGLQRDIDLLQSRRNSPGSTDRFRSAIDSHVAQLQEAQRQLRQDDFRASERANQNSTNAAAQQAAIEAGKYVDSVLKGAKALSQRTEELKKWDAAVAARAAAGSPLSQKDIDAGRAEINKRFADSGAATAANEYSNLVATIGAFNAETEQQLLVQRKLTDYEQFDIRIKEELAKSGKKLNADQRERILLSLQEAESRRKAAEIALRSQPLNSPESAFRSSELGDNEAVVKALRDAQQAEAAIRHTKIAQQELNDSASKGYEKASRAFRSRPATTPRSPSRSSPIRQRAWKTP